MDQNNIFILFIILIALCFAMASCGMSPYPEPFPEPSVEHIDPALTMEAESIASMTAAVRPVATETDIPTPDFTRTPDVSKCLVSTGSSNGTLNLRDGPGLAHIVVAVVNEGDLLEITDQTDDGRWFAVRTPTDRAGWVNSYYCTKQDN